MNDEAFGVEFEIGEESNRLFFFQAVIHVLYLSKLQKTDYLKIPFGGRL